MDGSDTTQTLWTNTVLKRIRQLFVWLHHTTMSDILLHPMQATTIRIIESYKKLSGICGESLHVLVIGHDIYTTIFPMRAAISFIEPSKVSQCRQRLVPSI